MMDEALKYLSDIHKAIVLMEDFTTGTMNYEDYSADLKTQSAVERQLGIIGEAVKKFDALMPEQALSQTRTGASVMLRKVFDG